LLVSFDSEIRMKVQPQRVANFGIGTLAVARKYDDFGAHHDILKRWPSLP
jgi:hypothetical protein